MGNSIVISGLDRKTFRKMVVEKNNLFKDLVVRIRQNEKDLIYYNGNKAFEVDGTDNIRISFPTNVYQCNTTDIKNNYIKDSINNYKTSLINICKDMSKYFSFKMDRIDIKRASEYDSTDFINKISKYAEKYKINNDLVLLGHELEDGKLHSIMFDASMTDITDIINAQFDFIDIMKLDECKKSNRLINAPTFNFIAIPNISEIIYSEDSSDLKVLINCFKNAIEKYTGKDELEKKYQHQFMLKECDSIDIFGNTKGIVAFEQEYGINKKEGRIDAIFTRIVDDSLEDIYLIELKVNDSVLLGTNGIMKHLEDVNYFINDESKDKNGKTQKQILLENIRYRYEVLNNKNSNFKFKNNNPRYHFYTIVGFTSKTFRDSADTIIKSLFMMDDDLTLQKKGINKVKPSLDKCKIKFFFEENNWNEKEGISINFMPKYEEELQNE